MVLHHLLALGQTHIHRVSDVIQIPHPLLSPSPPAPNPSQHQGLFQWVSSSHQVAKICEDRTHWKRYVLPNLIFITILKYHNTELTYEEAQMWRRGLMSHSKWQNENLNLRLTFSGQVPDQLTILGTTILNRKGYSVFQCSSVATQSCPTLCDPMNHSTPGLPVHHQLPESTQTHVHWVGDAIQPSHPLSSPSPALNLSQHQGLFKWVSSSHQVAKVLEFQLQHQSFQWIFRTDFL